MNLVLKKIFSLFFALTLIFSPLGGLFIAPKADAQISGAVAGCASGFAVSAVSAVSSFLTGTNVPVDDTKNNYKECMDAIAFALAKTLLAQLTNSIINWINTGFDGNPFYIGDTGSFFTNVIRDELQLTLNDLRQTGNIFIDTLQQEAIYRARATLHDQFEFTLDTDIVRGLCGYAEYQNQEFCTSQLTPESRYELAQAFTRGYIPFQWSTWDSLTQNCGNNIFCTSTSALNYQLAQRREQVQQLNDDLNRGDGFLSQKVCKDPGFQRDLEAWYEEVGSVNFVGTATSTQTGSGGGLFGDPLGLDSGSFRARPVCREYIIQTPGRIIADKLTSNLGTTERQYELADELNEAVAAIFNALIEKLINDGLSSFNNDGTGDYYESLNAGNSGFGYDTTTDSLNQDPEICERAGGIYDPDLEVCDTDSIPNFPWTMEDGTIVNDQQGFDSLIGINPETCIEIDGIRVHEGAEPCVVGVSGGETTGGIPPYPWTMEDSTIIANNTDFGNLITANITKCILIDTFTVNRGDEPCITGVSSATITTSTLTINPNPIIVGNLATFTLSGVSPETEFEILYTPAGETDLRSLATGTTDAAGAGTASIQIPNINTPQVLITVDVGGEVIEQSVRVSQ